MCICDTEQRLLQLIQRHIVGRRKQKTKLLQSETATQRYPPSVLVKVCEQEFPTMQYFDRLLPAIYRHSRYTAMNRREHMVVVYRGFTAFQGKILHRIAIEA